MQPLQNKALPERLISRNEVSRSRQQLSLCDGGTGGGHLELSCALGGHTPVPVLARVTSPRSRLSSLRLQ